MTKPAKMVLGATAIAAIASAVAAPQGLAAGGDYGPDTCLSGFVWRAAFPDDHVCVSPMTRTEAKADNAVAALRRDPNGAYGPNSCKAPFVWRGARPGDPVCVTVDTRRRAAADNAAAASRRNSVVLTLSTWTTPDTRTCSGDVCTTSNDGVTRHRVLVTNVNVGGTYLGLYRLSDRRPLAGWRKPAAPVAGRPGGFVAYRTNRLVCSGAPNAYFRVKDLTSGRWSARRYVRTGCSSL